MGQFHIERELGRGGTGAVYLAHDTKLDRPARDNSNPSRLRRQMPAIHTVNTGDFRESLSLTMLLSKCIIRHYNIWFIAREVS